jgi:hypothetical protein
MKASPSGKTLKMNHPAQILWQFIKNRENIKECAVSSLFIRGS